LRISFKIFLIITLFVVQSCQLFVTKNQDADSFEDRPLARVYNYVLYPSELEAVIPGLHGPDSAYLAEAYIQKWITRKVLLSHAESIIDESNEDINQKLQEYKEALLIHTFKEHYVREKLDTLITENEIQEYYDNNITSFELRENIFKGSFIKIPKDAPKIDKIRSLLASNNEKDKTELRLLCLRLASFYIVEDSLWHNFDEIIKNSPFDDISGKRQFLEKTVMAERMDNNYLYLIKIKDYKSSEQISPYEFARDQIRETLLNQRKINLINSLEENLYKQAKENNEIKIK